MYITVYGEELRAQQKYLRAQKLLRAQQNKKLACLCTDGLSAMQKAAVRQKDSAPYRNWTQELNPCHQTIYDKP